jgi:enoyl-CoA hydratase/carnithine racemase
MAERTVRVEHRDGVAWVTLDRPPLNLFNPSLVADLTATFTALRHDDSVRVAVIGATGKHMTGGMQLQELRDLDPASARALITQLHDAIDAVYTAPFPTIAMVHGACLGAGCELALACDLRVLATDARLGLPEVRVGIPSVIHAALLPHIVGPTRAAEMLLTGEPIDAQTALAWGLANRIVERDELRGETERLVESVLRGGVNAIRLQKELMIQWREMGVREGITAGIAAFARAYETREPWEVIQLSIQKLSLNT